MKDLEQLSEEQQAYINKIRQRVIESIGKNMDLYGVTLSIGHLYGNMYFNRSPVTLDEMSQTMGMSKTSISTGMRTLTDLKMINKVWGKGSRKDLYEVVPDWHQNFTDYFSTKWRKAVEINSSVLKKTLIEIQNIKQQEADDQGLCQLIALDEEKIVDALNYYNWLLRLIDSFETGAIFDFIPKTE
ncbi:MAG TPA: GbsR/MarR family transcriptional regulator [Candidatus Paenibacillus intestinavium]|nr:GbsR/MarR family transcriptional regulator [Candidatus Paenibacillus intestinavium]